MRALRQRHRRPVGWVVAIAILLYGWLPVLLQASLLSTEAHGDGRAHHAHHAGAPPDSARGRAPAGKSPECPVLHSAICLCAVLVKVLPPPAVAVPLAAAIPGRAGSRLRTRRPRRQARAAPFEARGPPFSD